MASSTINTSNPAPKPKKARKPKTPAITVDSPEVEIVEEVQPPTHYKVSAAGGNVIIKAKYFNSETMPDAIPLYIED